MDIVEIDGNEYFSINGGGSWFLFGGPLYDKLEHRRNNTSITAITIDHVMQGYSDRWERINFVDNGHVFSAYAYKDGELPPQGRYANIILDAKPYPRLTFRTQK